jgi:hypothetical protein
VEPALIRPRADEERYRSRVTRHWRVVVDKGDLFKLADLLRKEYEPLVNVDYFDYHPRDGSYALIVTLPDGSQETIGSVEDWESRYKPEVDAWREWLDRQEPELGEVTGDEPY